jgi:hypothetical protein
MAWALGTMKTRQAPQENCCFPYFFTIVGTPIQEKPQESALENVLKGIDC